MPQPDHWLGLTGTGPGCWSFHLTAALGRFDQKLYGGTGLAAVTAAIEAETERDALWVTAQFAASADVGDRLDSHVEVLAQGRRTSQVRVTTSVDQRLVVASLGAAALPRDGGVEVQIGALPVVP